MIRRDFSNWRKNIVKVCDNKLKKQSQFKEID